MNASLPSESTVPPPLPEVKLCNSCSAILPAETGRFCSYCGVRLEQIEESASKLKKYLWPAFYFFLPALLIPLLASLDVITTYRHFIYIDIGFSLFILFFFLSDFRSLASLYNLKNLHMLIWIIPVSVLGAFAVNYLVDFLHSHFTLEDSGLFYIFREAPDPLLYSIAFICIQPAVFEEMIFRGYINEKFRHIMSARTSIVISSFMFALLHFSLISLPWLFALGAFYGWLTIRYRNILLSSAAHFTHNFVVMVLSVDFGLPEYLNW